MVDALEASAVVTEESIPPETLMTQPLRPAFLIYVLRASHFF